MFPEDELPIKYSQFIQLENGRLILNIVPYQNKPVNEKHMDKLYKMIDDKVGLNNIDLSINIIDESQIIYSGRGKFNLIVSYRK